jgi:hypothetical protein
VSVSTSPFYTIGDDASFDPAISSDGTHIVYTSRANNLVSGDTNAKADVFEFDLGASTTTRVSLASGGTQLNGDSGLPSLSSDGHLVAFASDATNAVAIDSNGVRDVFVRDTSAGTTQRVSVSTASTQGSATSEAPTISGDGRFVGFESDASNLVSSDTNGVRDVFVRDRMSSATLRASTTQQLAQANGASTTASLSRDGRTIGFSSLATNIDPNIADTNGFADVYVRATRPPTVTSFTPLNLTRGTSVAFTLTGDGFLTGPNPMLGGPAQVTFTIATVTNTTITGTVTVGASAATGPQNLVVGNPGTGAGQLTGAAAECLCFRVL